MGDVTVKTSSDSVAVPDVDMSIELAGFSAPDPVFTASGCAAAGRELAAFNDLTAIGGVVTKSIQLAPRSGRPTPRMAETPSGMLNSIGLQGPGIEAFLRDDLAWLDEHGARAVVSLAGSSVDDYAALAGRLRGRPVSLIEVNISCPNVEDRGQVFACDANAAADVVHAVRRTAPSHVPVFAKLSPDVTDIVSIARACVDAGADGLSLINTTLGIVVDTQTMRPALAGVTGGLSGPAIRPLAVRCVWQVHAALPDVPLMGIGGIRTGVDALEFLLAGASAVQVGTVIFHDPSAPSRISAELRQALAARGVATLRDVVGLAHRPPVLSIPADPDPPGDEPVTATTAPQAVTFEEAAHDH
jgi:dihydroorotate dehydrogenase (NAD+) catalytic subunit